MGLVFARPVGRGVDSGRYASVRAPLVPVVVYLLASTGGGAVTAGVVGLSGDALRRTFGDVGWFIVGVSGLALAVYAVYLTHRHRVHPLPERRRQVPRGWTTWRSKTRTAAAFGAMLGAGVFTYLKHADAYVLAVIIVLSASVPDAALVGVAYGFARGFVLVVMWRRRGSSPVRAISLAEHLVPVVGAVATVVIGLHVLSSTTQL